MRPHPRASTIRGAEIAFIQKIWRRLHLKDRNQTVEALQLRVRWRLVFSSALRTCNTAKTVGYFDKLREEKNAFNETLVLSGLADKSGPVFSCPVPLYPSNRSDLGAQIVVAIKVYLIGLACCLKQLFRWRQLSGPYTALNDLVSHCQPLAIVTGGTAGLGLALCQLLAPKWRLIIIGRDRIQGHLAVEQIKRRCGQSKVIFYSVDLSSRKSINEFLEIFIKTFDRLHLLVNNAGVMMPPYKAVGASGDIELQWAVNFLAPAYLSDRLRPCLQRALRQDGFSRVINVSSAALYAASLSQEYFACAGGCNGSPNTYSSHLAYANSKMALSLYTELYASTRSGRDEDDIVMCSVHPGVIGTDLYRNSNVFMRWLTGGWIPFIGGRIILTPEQAANDVLWTCLSPSVEAGAFYENGTPLPLPVVKAEVKMALWKHLERQDIISRDAGVLEE